MMDAAFFARARLFQGLTAEEIEAVAAVAVRRSIAAEQEILRMGDANESLFLIRSGQVKVERFGVERSVGIATLGPGEIFGEMSFMDSSRTTGTVRALGSVELLEIQQKAFDDLLGRMPALAGKMWRNLALHMRDRLAEANGVIDHYADMEQLLRDRPQFRDAYGGI